MFGLGALELTIILVILLVLFGATRLPKLARSIGESAGELQKGFNGSKAEAKKEENTQQN